MRGREEERREDRWRDGGAQSGGRRVLKLGPLHSGRTESLERDNGLEEVAQRRREGEKGEEESTKMMITLDSQQHGTAETEIMMEGEARREKRQ